MPKAIRQAFGVGSGGRSAFREEDPALGPFFALLERDIAARRPEALFPFPPDLPARMEAATKGVEVDLDAPIEGEVA